MASHAPRPSIIDCRNSRSVREATVNAPPRSEAAIVAASDLSLSVPARAIVAERIPSPFTVSPSVRARSEKWAASAVARFASAWSLPVRIWFSTARLRSRTPEHTASSPSIQWKTNSRNRKTGVQGASKKANGPGPDAKRCIASRSRRPVAGAERVAGAPAAWVRIAPRTRLSSRF